MTVERSVKDDGMRPSKSGVRSQVQSLAAATSRSMYSASVACLARPAQPNQKLPDRCTSALRMLLGIANAPLSHTCTAGDDGTSGAHMPPSLPIRCCGGPAGVARSGIPLALPRAWIGLPLGPGLGNCGSLHPRLGADFQWVRSFSGCGPPIGAPPAPHAFPLSAHPWFRAHPRISARPRLAVSEARWAIGGSVRPSLGAYPRLAVRPPLERDPATTQIWSRVGFIALVGAEGQERPYWRPQPGSSRQTPADLIAGRSKT